MKAGLIGFSFVVALGVAGLGGAAQAMPVPADNALQSPDVTPVAQGCGPGWRRGPYGGCRPIYGPPRVYGPPRHVGPGCVMRRTPYGVRRVCRY
jgi:hypothetical protein